MTLDELVGAGCDKDKAKEIMSMVPYVRRYYDFKAMTKLGVTITPKDLDFDKGLIYAWIAEGDSGRGN